MTRTRRLLAGIALVFASAFTVGIVAAPAVSASPVDTCC